MVINELREMLSKYNKLSLGNYPTPLEEMSNYSKKIGFKGSLYMKRDDMTANPGGNKVRHLEYIMADALSSKCDLFIIACPVQSNFCTMAAIVCRKLKLPCLLIHNGEKPKRYEGNALLNELMGVERVFLGDIDEFERGKRAAEIRDDIIKQGRKPYMYGDGNSKPLSSLGYVECVAEIYDQIELENKPIDNVFIPGGTGTCESGVIYGAGLLDKPFHVNVISVEYEKEYLRGNIEKKIKEIETLTKVRLNYPLDDIMTIYDDYRGNGWACDTEGTIEAIYEMAEEEGIFLEKVYTGKCVHGMKDLLQSFKVESKGACYIHTGGFPSLFSQF